MGRSSSSHKKKRSKSSSRGRIKKKSKIRSRKSESKKKLRHNSSDDDDSRSSMSGSYYSSSPEDTKHRTKKSQVRSKKHVAVKKKKYKKRRSYSSESSEESPRARNRNGLKRKRDYDSNKKSYSKKKRKRDENISYSNDGSLSSSTCEGDSINGVEFERHGREDRTSEKVERETKRSRLRSISPPCSERSEDSEYRVEGRGVSVENNSRRLRSVIVCVVAERENENEKEKEEVIFHDDYPSSRSNDSNDSGNKNEEQERKIGLENEKPDGTVVSGLEIPKTGYALRDPLDDFEEKINAVNEKAKSDDLEAVLRQRALENLRKFRRVTSSYQKDKHCCEEKKLSNPKAESVEDGTQIVNNPSASTETKDSNFLSRVEENRKVMDISNNKAMPVNPNIDQTSVSGSSKEKVSVGVQSVRPKLVRPVFSRQVSETYATSVNHESRDELQRSKSCLDETASGIVSTTVASEEPSLGETRSDKPPEEGKDSSQFENKTMSVMRGGEMVQVSYKVFIPKKTPALARRNLKR